MKKNTLQKLSSFPRLPLFAFSLLILGLMEISIQEIAAKGSMANVLVEDQKLANAINTNFGDGTWGTPIKPIVFSNWNKNGFVITNGCLYPSSSKCPKGQTHTNSISISPLNNSDQSIIGQLDFPVLKTVEQIEIHASSGSDGRNFVVKELVDGNWKKVGTYTTNKAEEIFSIPIVRKEPTKLRIENNSYSTLYITQIITISNTVLQNSKTSNINKVSGIISDDINKEPLIGVNIKIKDKNIGTISDINGKYSINAATNDVLIFSYIGYKSVSIKVDRSIQNIELAEDALRLGEVEVQAGYGTMKKRDITGAVVSITDKDIEKRMTVNVLDALQGAAAGVQVMSNTGEPGSESTIRIRGTSTLTDAGVAPLYILDGMTVDRIDNINPNDIQSMEVLKDAASTAIYGSRSANGVIIITTKKGVVGKPKLDVKYLRAYTQLSHKLPQATSLERSIFDNRILTIPGVTRLSIDSLSLSANVDNDYQAILTQTGVRNQVDASLSGGTKELKYFNSFQYYDETGIVRNSWLKRLTGRINIDYTPNQVISTGSRFDISYTNKNQVNEGQVIAKSLLRIPSIVLTFPDGTPAYLIGGQINPLAEETLRKNETSQYGLKLNEYVNINISKDLVFRTELSGKFDLSRNEQFSSKLISTSIPQYNTGQEQMNWNTYLSGTSYLTYNKSFDKKHNIQAVLGISVEDWNSLYSSLGGNKYVSETVTTGNSISELIPAKTTSFKEDHSMIGSFFRGKYDYKSRYIFNATVRRDGSSRFGANHRWGWFPSLSGAWRLSDESFMKWSKTVLSDAKIRGGWGITGNERIGNYVSQNQYGMGTNFYNNISGVTTINTLGNPNLKWEETNQSNVGVDLMFFDGAIKLTADYYVKNTKDLLNLTSLPQESGFQYSWMNFGSIRNNGLEISVSATPIKTRYFSWNTTVNYSQNENVITSLPGGDMPNQIWWVGVGSAAGTFYGYKYLGIYAYDQSNAWTADFKTNLTPVFKEDAQGNVIIDKNRQPTLLNYSLPDGSVYSGTVYQKKTDVRTSKGGDVIWDEVPDANGVIDGSITSTDRQIIGNANPKWYGSWNNTMTYKAFSLSFAFYGAFGGQLYNEAARVPAGLSSVNPTPQPFYIYNFWKYPGQLTPLYNGNDKSGTNSRVGSSYFLEDASFIRLQTIRLGYTLDKRIASKTFLTSAQVYIYANGLLTWTKYTGFDPEVSNTSVLYPGNDTGRYPRKREFGFGINLTL